MQLLSGGYGLRGGPECDLYLGAQVYMARIDNGDVAICGEYRNVEARGVESDRRLCFFEYSYQLSGQPYGIVWTRSRVHNNHPCDQLSEITA